MRWKLFLDPVEGKVSGKHHCSSNTLHVIMGCNADRQQQEYWQEGSAWHLPLCRIIFVGKGVGEKI
jgi:hypothetical protein